MGDNTLCSLGRGASPLERLWRGDFVNQKVYSLGMPDEIVRDARVAREHHGAPCMIDPVPERRLDRRVIHLKRRYLHTALLVYHSLTDILSEDNDAVGRCPVVVQPDADVVLIRLFKVRHHLLGSPWAPDVQRAAASSAHEPTRQPQIRKADHVIRMKVCEEYAIHILPPDSELGETLQSASTRIEEELPSSGLDQDTRPESIHDRGRTACTQESDLDLLPGGIDWSKSR
jgi:hypothetical protein